MNPVSGENSERLLQITGELLRFLWESKPVEASLTGIHDFDDTIGDITGYALSGHAAVSQGFVRRFEEEINPSLLSPDELIDYRVGLSLASTNHIYLAEQKQWETNPGIYPSLAIWGCYSLLQQEFAPLEDRLSSVISRMREIPGMLEVSKWNLTEVARIYAESAVEITAGGIHFFENVLPSFASRSESQAVQILNETVRVVEAMQAYLDWLRKDVLPNAKGEFAVGPKIFQQMIFSQHYLTYGNDSLVSLAESLLESSTAEIRKVAALIDPESTWQQLVERLSYEHPPIDGLVDTYRDAIESAKAFVLEKDLVTIPPNETLTVQETPEFERPVLPFAAYYPPAPFDALKAGRFWVTPIDRSAPEKQQLEQLAGHCSYTIPIRALHEGYPGHHLQLSRVVDIRSPIRKQSTSNLMIEGWALYCERMAQEQGFITDPRVRLFQLKDVIWRACRVIIDIGIQTSEMTFDEAVRMLVEKAALKESAAISEIKRYVITPTQPMTYAIGALLIEDIKRRMERRLGSRFDLKTFHDRLLDFGSIPPTIISESLFWQTAQTDEELSANKAA